MPNDPNQYKVADQRYNAILKRSFSIKLEIFLFNELFKNKSLGTIKENDFVDFNVDDNLIERYLGAYKMRSEENIDGISGKEMDKRYNEWYNENQVEKNKLLKIYSEDFKIKFPMTVFEELYKSDKDERCCYYCGITEKEISVLKEGKLINTKRNRGKHMEIDRQNSNKEYNQNDIVLACYWCNNAKSDEFTLDEFKQVGKEIRKLWELRLAKLNSP